MTVSPPESDTPTQIEPSTTSGRAARSPRSIRPVTACRARVDPVERCGGRGHDPDAAKAGGETVDRRGGGEARPLGDLAGGRVDAQHLVVASATSDDPDGAVADRDCTGLVRQPVLALPARPREHPREIGPSARVDADEPGAGACRRPAPAPRRHPDWLGAATTVVVCRTVSVAASISETDGPAVVVDPDAAPADSGRGGSQADADDRTDLVRRRVDADERVRLDDRRGRRRRRCLE